MRTIDFTPLDRAARQQALQKQWLVTNGLGGFASGTLSGAVNWKYHGLLIAALPGPLGRTVMLNYLGESVLLPDGSRQAIGGFDADPTRDDGAARCLARFQLERHLPTWRFELADVVIEKRVLMPNLQNTVHVTYTLVSGPAGLKLQLQPAVQFRPLEASVSTPLSSEYEVRLFGPRVEIAAHEQYPPLRLLLHGAPADWEYHGGGTLKVFYERDAHRGYDAQGELWTPGQVSVPIRVGEAVTLVASTEEWRTLHALDPASASATEHERRHRLQRIANPAVQTDALGEELVLAADQFVIFPNGRVRDAARARARGDELRSVIAGYHWFTDWGRDTMISLEGLTMTTGRYQEAAWILRTFASYVRDGLIPNLFPEGENEGLYHTADASLWFFQAVHRYTTLTRERETLRGLLTVLRDIVEHHVRGTRFGIHVDAADGLLVQGAPGYQLTWMDAKVGDWVVTPRRGKAVEINALWYNAVRLLEGWLRDEGDIAGADTMRSHAEKAAHSFNARFWNPARECLFDVVDGENGDDASVRPNQIMAVSLPHAVLEPKRWAAVVRIVQEKLLTPVGMRSLSPEHPDFKPTYTGDLRARDAAYHQGTVWAWLIGPFIDAWLKVNPGKEREARGFLDGFSRHMSEGCVGSISEIFDAEPPFTDRGCVAQAWSVAEVLRCVALTAAAGG